MKKGLWGQVVALWCVFAIRAHDILTLPAFVDESLHILRSQVVYQFSDPVASFLPGKLLVYYYFGLFNAENHNALWLSRQAVALLAPLSAALCFALARRLGRSTTSGTLAIWLYALTPLLIFFERMALSDTFAGVFALGLTLASLHFAHKPTTYRAAITGSLLGLALLAKLTALPLGAVPLLAMVLFGKIQLRPLILCYFVAGFFMLLPAFYVVYQEVAQLEDKQEVVTTTLFVPENQSRLEQIRANVETYSKALYALNGLQWFLLPLALLGFWRRSKVLLYLAGILALSWGFILLASAFPTTRYLGLTFALVLVIIAVGLAELRLPRNTALLALLLMLPLSIPFMRHSWQDPTQLKLGNQDEWEYFRHISSAYALRDVAEEMKTLDEPVYLEGFVGSCHSLRFYLPESVHLYCPYFRFYDNPALTTPEDWMRLTTENPRRYFLMEPYAELEQQPLFDAMDQDPLLIGSYERPHDGIPTRLYETIP